MGRVIDEEDAINAILREYNTDDSDYPTDYQQGLSAAKKIIEKLPSAQSEPSTEIQEILNYLDTTLHPIVSPDNWDVYDELYDMVSGLPPAQPERPKGKWIWELDEGDPSRSMMLVCSICGSGRNEVGTYNFCNICGAKMINPRGEQDED